MPQTKADIVRSYCLWHVLNKIEQSRDLGIANQCERNLIEQAGGNGSASARLSIMKCGLNITTLFTPEAGPFV